jgi:hypothetical protein
MTTGEMLDLLATLGRPAVRRFEDGKWHATVEFPAPAGVTAKVASDFNHPTHESALIQLLARVRDMTDMGDKISRSLATIGGNVVELKRS